MWGAIISAVLTLIGSAVQAQGNNNAVDRLAKITKMNNRLREAEKKEIEAKYRVMEKYAEPGIKYLRNLVNQDPYELTPEQQDFLGDVRRKTVGYMSPALRGSGRYRTAAIRDVEGRVRNQLYGINLDRSEGAALSLGTMMPEAIAGKAGATRNLYRQLAEANYGLARERGAADIANAQLGADTLGSIGRIFAEYGNERSRPSRYAGYRMQYQDDPYRKFNVNFENRAM